MDIKFTRKVAGIYTAQINGTRELVLHRAGGWRLSIRDIGTTGFGTDLRLVRPKLDDAQAAARTFVGQLVFAA